MSESASEFDVVEPGTSNLSRPQLTVYSNAGGYVNSAADRSLLDQAPAVRVMVNSNGSRLALEPTDEDDDLGYAVTRVDDTAGGDVRLQAALKRAGVDIDSLEETTFLDLREEEGLAVADLDPLFESADGGGSDSEEDQTDTTPDHAETPTPDHTREDEGLDLQTAESSRQAVLNTLEETGEISGPRLKEVCDVSTTIIYDVLKDLEKLGQVTRRKDPEDGRRKLFSLVEDAEADHPAPKARAELIEHLTQRARRGADDKHQALTADLASQVDASLRDVADALRGLSASAPDGLDVQARDVNSRTMWEATLEEGVGDE